MHKEIIVFILNSKKEVLLQKRSATKLHHPNKWALCSGHVEGFDEDFECAAIRELKEELGLDVSKEELSLIDTKEMVDNHNDKHITKYYIFYTDKNSDEFILQKEELSEVKWYNLEEVIKMMENKDETIVFSDNMLSVLKELGEQYESR